MFWPIHAGCSNMSPQPELDDLPTSNLKVLSPLHKHKSYDLNNHNSHVNIMHRRLENRPVNTTYGRLSLKFSNPHCWKRCSSPQVLRQRKDAYFASLRPLLPATAWPITVGALMFRVFGCHRRLMSMRRSVPRSLTCLVQSKTHQHKTHELTRSHQYTRGVSSAAPHRHRQRSLHPRLLRRLCVTLHWYVRRCK